MRKQVGPLMGEQVTEGSNRSEGRRLYVRPLKALSEMTKEELSEYSSSLAEHFLEIYEVGEEKGASTR